jgi:hypothetical protein
MKMKTLPKIDHEMANKKINNLIQMESQTKVDILLTPTKSHFEAKTPIQDIDRDMPDNKRNFKPASDLKFSPSSKKTTNEIIDENLNRKFQSSNNMIKIDL